MATYRRRKGNDEWHFCRNCSNDPKANFEETTTSGRPSNGELCNECRSKESKGNCTS